MMRLILIKFSNESMIKQFSKISKINPKIMTRYHKMILLHNDKESNNKSNQVINQGN